MLQIILIVIAFVSVSSLIYSYLTFMERANAKKGMSPRRYAHPHVAPKVIQFDEPQPVNKHSSAKTGIGIDAREYVLERFGDQVLDSNSREMVRIKIGNTVVSAHAERVGQISVCRLSTHWPDLKFRMKIYPETIPEDKKRMMGLQDIQVGNRRFDPSFIVQANDEVELRETFTGKAQQALLSLYPLEVNFSILNGAIDLEFIREFDSRDDGKFICGVIEQFVIAYEDMVETHHSGSLFDVGFQRNNEATCMVCGDQTDSSLAEADLTVFCQNCQTPHHRECWEFMGCCSTFACGETEFDLG